MVNTLKDMLDFGINLKLSGPEEDKYYCQRLRYYIMEHEDFDAESEDDEVVSVWFMHEKVLDIQIKDSTLTFERIDDNSYESIMLILSFVSEMHDIVQEEFMKIENNFDDFEDSHPIQDVEEDSDDFEWI
jgi:ferredoxin-fold anticodon binding domain-containing protein